MWVIGWILVVGVAVAAPQHPFDISRVPPHLRQKLFSQAEADAHSVRVAAQLRTPPPTTSTETTTVATTAETTVGDVTKVADDIPRVPTYRYSGPIHRAVVRDSPQPLTRTSAVVEQLDVVDATPEVAVEPVVEPIVESIEEDSSPEYEQQPGLFFASFEKTPKVAEVDRVTDVSDEEQPGLFFGFVDDVKVATDVSDEEQPGLFFGILPKDEVATELAGEVASDDNQAGLFFGSFVKPDDEAEGFLEMSDDDNTSDDAPLAKTNLRRR